jgi:HSP20 family protein
MAKNATNHLPHGFAYLGFHTSTSHTAWTPNTDVYETGGTLVVKMEIAGIEREDLEITLNDRLLLVRGHRKDPCRQREQRCVFRQMEIDYGFFERRIVIPRSVDGSRVRAQFRNGFLQIELPKSQQSEHRTVTVIIEQAS